MTVYARVARTAGRTAARAQRRQMGGSHAPAPEWTGIDKVVRGYFPEDYQREFLHRGPFNRLARGDAWKLVRTHVHDQRISKSERAPRLEEDCLPVTRFRVHTMGIGWIFAKNSFCVGGRWRVATSCVGF